MLLKFEKLGALKALILHAMNVLWGMQASSPKFGGKHFSKPRRVAIAA